MRDSIALYRLILTQFHSLLKERVIRQNTIFGTLFAKIRQKLKQKGQKCD